MDLHYRCLGVLAIRTKAAEMYVCIVLRDARRYYQSRARCCLYLHVLLLWQRFAVVKGDYCAA